VPQVVNSANVTVRAPAEAAFGVVAGDILAVDDDPGAMQGHRPIDAGPLRPGFRWQQTLVHERKVCRTDWTVTRLESPSLLEQTMEHLCAVSLRELLGGERWEFKQSDDGATFVTLRGWMQAPGLDGWLRKLAGDKAAQLSMKKRLASVQFKAERTAQPAPPAPPNA
jgi:hypothetical protein